MSPYKVVSVIIVYFFATSIVGSIIGWFIDSQLGIKPKGTLAALLVSYVISWVGVYMFLKRKKVF